MTAVFSSLPRSLRNPRIFIKAGLYVPIDPLVATHHLSRGIECPAYMGNARPALGKRAWNLNQKTVGKPRLPILRMHANGVVDWLHLG